MIHHIPFDSMEQFMIDVFTGIGRLKPIYYDRIGHQKIQQATTSARPAIAPTFRVENMPTMHTGLDYTFGFE